MPPEEAILFVAVIALALALVAVVVGPKVRSGRQKRDEAPVPGPPAGALDDATGATEVPLPPPVATPVAPPPTPAGAWNHLVCPTCRRQFAAGLRYCPYDARMLLADGLTTSPEPDREPSDPPQRETGKICPTCARRYESMAVVCARDGAPLVSVN